LERRIVNPWTWQDEFGYVQANETSGVERVLVCAGQTSVDADGAPLLAQAGCRPASTLLGVARLAIPSLMVEIEATAVR
jgi:enamine deaminase RidA (YjgF/YER057c/UK114 family)